MHLEKLFNEILLQLKEESKKYKKLKVCKYSFEISKVAILSLATGLSFINIFAILFIYSESARQISFEIKSSNN